MLRRRAPVLAPLLLLVSLLALPGARCTDPPGQGPPPVPGLIPYHALGWVPVPMALVNVLGGNLVVSRRHLVIDTRVAPLELGATYNSASRGWSFSFALRYAGGFLVDATGGVHAVGAVAPGRAIPGTGWIVVDANTLVTKGGLVHEFDANGRLARVHWRSSDWPRLVYRSALVAGESRIVEIVQWNDAQTSVSMATVEHDAAGRVVAVEDRAGRRAEYQRDAEGRLVVARSPGQVDVGGPGERYDYAADLLTGITNPEGETAVFGHSSGRLRLARGLGEGDPTWSFVYRGEAGGRARAEVFAPDGARRVVRYDAGRRVRELVNPLGEATTLEWTASRPSALTTPAGVTTRWVLEDDDVVQILEPSGNVQSFHWEPTGENRAAPGRRALRDAWDLLGPLESRGYDASGRLVRVTNGAGESWTLGWGADGGLASVTDPSGVETRLRDRGNHGRARELSTGSSVVALRYDAVGNRLGGPSAGGVAGRAFDADRHLVAVELADLHELLSLESVTLRVERRSDGRPLRVVRPGGPDTEFVYDALGRLTARGERVDGVLHATTYEYDAVGRPTAVTRANGMRVEVGYDAAGRRIRLVLLRGGVEESHASWVYEDGRLVARLDSVWSERREDLLYDAAGRVDGVVYPNGETLLLDHDLRGRVVGETYRSAEGSDVTALGFAYDGAGREVEATADGALLLERTYQDARLASLRHGNGLVRSFTWDASDGVLRDAVTVDAQGAVVEATHLERTLETSGVPFLSWHAETSTAGGVPFTSHEHFTLAPAAADGPGLRAGRFSRRADGGGGVRFVHDPRSRRLAENEGTSTRSFEYDAGSGLLERVRRDGSVERAYAWDEAGFAVVRGGETLQWDGAGRPRALGSRATWLWDSFGRLVAESRDGELRRRAFGGRIVTDLSGQPQRVELGLVSLDLVGGDHHYRLHDFRGNVKVVTDSGGGVVAHYRYGPWGPDRIEGSPDGEASFAFGASAGELLRLGHRLYDPDVGSFLAPDPVFGLVSAHAYALGNPVLFWDPDGRRANTAMGIASGAALGAMAVGAVVGGPVGVGIVLAAGSFVAGLVTPVTATSLAAGQAGAAITIVHPVSRGVGLGFWAGQEMQQAIQEDFATPKPEQDQRPCACGPPRPLPPPPQEDRPDDGAGRELSLEAVPEAGCSPVAAGATPALGRELVLALGLLHLVLGAAWARRARRTGREDRR